MECNKQNDLQNHKELNAQLQVVSSSKSFPDSLPKYVSDSLSVTNWSASGHGLQGVGGTWSLVWPRFVPQSVRGSLGTGDSTIATACGF